MEIINADLIAMAKLGYFDYIVHGCNCFCKMGSGFARQVKKHFPEAYEVDKKTKKGDRAKLGTFSLAVVEGYARPFTVVNAYTQYKYGMGQIHIDYMALEQCFYKLNQIVNYDQRIAYPKIGAGLAGGNWETISTIIDQELEGHKHYLVDWDKAPKR